MSGLQALIDAWKDKRSVADPYGSVEEFAEASHAVLWPYAVIHEQIEAGWNDDETRSALALQLAKGYKAPAHALAAFVVLCGKWPENNVTAALNLLALAHLATPPSERWLHKFLSHAALECMKRGLLDPHSLVSEESANVLGGLGQSHFVAGTDEKLGPLEQLARSVIGRIDQAEVAHVLGRRIDAVFSEASEAISAVSQTEICDVDAKLMLKEIEPQWRRLAPKQVDAQAVATIKSHVAALAWRCASREPRSVQVVYVSPANGDTQHRGWSIVEPWSDAIQALLKDEKRPQVPGLPKPTPRTVSFEALDAMNGSLLVALHVDADGATQEAITKILQTAKSASTEGGQFDEIIELLDRQKIRLRVAHVEADGGSASIAIGPNANAPTSAPYRHRKLTTNEVPQANDLDKVIAVVDRTGNEEAISPVAIGVTTERQVQYYKAAARILSLVATPSGALTRAGWLVYVAKGDDKYVRVCAAFEASPCGQAWLDWANVAKLKDIKDGTAERFLTERSELSGDTISRRANTLNQWLAKLRNY